MRRLVASVALILGVSANQAFADIRHMATDQLASLRFGIFCVGPAVGRTDAPETISGIVDTVEESRLVLPVSVVPAELGLTFGVEFQGQSGVVGPVVLTTFHPPMGADQVTQQTWVSNINDTSSASVFYTFDYSFELVTGPWRLEAEYDGALIYSVEFQVVSQGLAPAAECDSTPLLSLGRRLRSPA